MLDTLTLDAFTPLVGTVFQGADDTGAAAGDFTLVEARSLASPATRAEAARRLREPFSLLFTGPATPTLPQRTYRLTQPRLGAVEIFLVPIGPGRYEAIFT